MNTLKLRKIHRWLGLFAGIQLLAWTVSGLYFTVIPIEEIHGDHLMTQSDAEKLTLSSINLLSPSELAARNPGLADIAITSIRLTDTLGTPIYLVDGIRYHAITGAELQPLTEDEALKVGSQRTDIEIVSVNYVEEVPVDSEYRGGELPAYQLLLAEENAAIYVGAATGRVRAVRTEAWRWFDFLWSLHIMDYDEREDFNHWLIQILAIMGLITVGSGLVLFFLTQRWPTK